MRIDWQVVDGVFAPIPLDGVVVGPPGVSDDSADSAIERGDGSAEATVSPGSDYAPSADYGLPTGGDPLAVVPTVAAGNLVRETSCGNPDASPRAIPAIRDTWTGLLMVLTCSALAVLDSRSSVGPFLPNAIVVLSHFFASTCGVQIRTFAGNDGVGFFIHGPSTGHMLHNYRHGQTDVSCDYVLNYQTISVGAESVARPPAPGHPLLVPFGYSRDPVGFQVLIRNVRDISLGFNHSLVRGLIVALNPAIVNLTETRTRDLESFVPFVDSFDFGSNVLHHSVLEGSAGGGVWVLYREGLVMDLFRYHHRHLEMSIRRAA
ncbi:uncharacterized protein G2W53_035041 [Senna tora]|uniref:Uncharacterized protein n=1 Tax=Senna tora TaxID=362788 RepID=A0A834SPF5_9FABA|nr:uncharacterized protein G2W53_035041 [Senna tora]